MSAADAVLAVRRGVTLSVLDDVHAIRLVGDGAKAAVERLLPCDMALRNGQARATLLLDEAGRVLADATVARQDESYLILTEGLASEALVTHVRRVVGDAAGIEDLSASHRLLSINGPYAWQLMAAHEGSGIAALRYMTIYCDDETLCLRAGKTGEYGYDLLVPARLVAPTVERLLVAGRDLDLLEIDRQVLSICAFEAWFFDAHHPGMRGLSPLELGLQWRVSYDRSYVGFDALNAARQHPLRRLTALRAEAPLGDGDAVVFGDRVIGRVVRAAWSPSLDGHIGAALIDRPYAHSGVHAVVARGTDGRSTALRTVSPPFINNLSLFVKPGRDRYADRNRVRHPGLDAERAPRLL